MQAASSPTLPAREVATSTITALATRAWFPHAFEIPLTHWAGFRLRGRSTKARCTRDLDQTSARATLQSMEPAHVTLTGDLSGDYVVEDRRPDGRVLLRPDLSVKAMLARHGERKLTPEEFEQHFGQLPTDGEG